MLISLNVGLQAYPKKAKLGNPSTLSGRSVGRATTAGKLAVTTILLAGISIGRATTRADLATNTVKLAGATMGRATTSAKLTMPKLLSGISIGRATTVGKFPTVTSHLLVGSSLGRATTTAKLTMTRLLAGSSLGRATTTSVLTVAGAAPEFSPTSIAGLQMWFDASQITGKVDGDVMPSWSDLSSFARHATQATAAKQPLYKTAIKNGKPVVRFDGVDDFLQTATTFMINQPDTIITVAFFRGAGEAAGILFDAGGATGGRQFVRRSVNQYTLYAGNAPLKEAGTSTPVWSVITTTLSGSTGNVYLNGPLLITGSAGSSNSQGITLAANYVGTENSNLDVAEFIVYNSSLSTANRQAVEQYLSAKWGVAVA